MSFASDTLIPLDKSASGAVVVPDGFTELNDELYFTSPPADHTARAVVYALGSFWSQQFSSKDILEAFIEGSALLSVQTYLDYLEAVSCVNRFSVPVSHRRVWYALVIRESTMNTSGPAILKYDGFATYGEGYRYGVPIKSSLHTVKIDEIQNVSVLMNNILAPSLTLVQGTDFSISDHLLTLRLNPFSDTRVPLRNVVDSNGKVIDRECVLWAYNTQEDWEYIYQHYAFAIRKRLRSSDSYKSMVNAMLNGIVGGLSNRDLLLVAAAAAGLPVVVDAKETVEKILKHNDRLVIVTNSHSYIYPVNAVASVVVGQEVFAGDVLVDTVRVFDLANNKDAESLVTSLLLDSDITQDSSSAGAANVHATYRATAKMYPKSSGRPLLRAMVLPKSLLGDGYTGSLLYANIEGNITSTMDASGRLKGTITEVYGAQEDIDKFWTNVHTNGVLTKTWLELYGTGLSKINPAGFVIDAFLRNNTVVLHLRTSKFSHDAVGLTFLDVVRRVYQPDKLLLVIIDMEAEETLPLATTTTVTTFPIAGNRLETVAATDGGAIIFSINDCS